MPFDSEQGGRLEYIYAWLVVNKPEYGVHVALRHYLAPGLHRDCTSQVGMGLVDFLRSTLGHEARLQLSVSENRVLAPRRTIKIRWWRRVVFRERASNAQR